MRLNHSCKKADQIKSVKNFKLDFIYVADASDVGHLLDVATRAAEIENAFFRRGNNAGGHFKIQNVI